MTFVSESFARLNMSRDITFVPVTDVSPIRAVLAWSEQAGRSPRFSALHSQSTAGRRLTPSGLVGP